MNAQTEYVHIAGPTGLLEVARDRPVVRTGQAVGQVVIAHPHPLFGGTMHNKVAYTLARAFVQLGYAALRFNFRGIENSEGEYDKGVGELDDALAAISWMRARDPGARLWLAGFSFGAAIAVDAAVDTAVDGLVSVAPAITRYASG